MATSSLSAVCNLIQAGKPTDWLTLFTYSSEAEQKLYIFGLNLSPFPSPQSAKYNLRDLLDGKRRALSVYGYSFATRNWTLEDDAFAGELPSLTNCITIQRLLDRHINCSGNPQQQAALRKDVVSNEIFFRQDEGGSRAVLITSTWAADANCFILERNAQGCRFRWQRWQLPELPRGTTASLGAAVDWDANVIVLPLMADRRHFQLHSLRLPPPGVTSRIGVLRECRPISGSLCPFTDAQQTGSRHDLHLIGSSVDGGFPTVCLLTYAPRTGKLLVETFSLEHKKWASQRLNTPCNVHGSLLLGSDDVVVLLQGGSNRSATDTLNAARLDLSTSQLQSTDGMKVENVTQPMIVPVGPSRIMTGGFTCEGLQCNAIWEVRFGSSTSSQEAMPIDQPQTRMEKLRPPTTRPPPLHSPSALIQHALHDTNQRPVEITHRDPTTDSRMPEEETGRVCDDTDIGEDIGAFSPSSRVAQDDIPVVFPTPPRGAPLFSPHRERNDITFSSADLLDASAVQEELAAFPDLQPDVASPQRVEEEEDDDMEVEVEVECAVEPLGTKLPEQRIYASLASLADGGSVTCFHAMCCAWTLGAFHTDRSDFVDTAMDVIFSALGEDSADTCESMILAEDHFVFFITEMCPSGTIQSCDPDEVCELTMLNVADPCLQVVLSTDVALSVAEERWQWAALAMNASEAEVFTKLGLEEKLHRARRFVQESVIHPMRFHSIASVVLALCVGEASQMNAASIAMVVKQIFSPPTPAAPAILPEHHLPAPAPAPTPLDTDALPMESCAAPVHRLPQQEIDDEERSPSVELEVDNQMIRTSLAPVRDANAMEDAPEIKRKRCEAPSGSNANISLVVDVRKLVWLKHRGLANAAAAVVQRQRNMAVRPPKSWDDLAVPDAKSFVAIAKKVFPLYSLPLRTMTKMAEERQHPRKGIVFFDTFLACSQHVHQALTKGSDEAASLMTDMRMLASL